jgi:hypothetical protein
MELFALGIAFWVVAVGVLIALVVSLECEAFSVTTFAVALGGVALLYLGGSSLSEFWATLTSDPARVVNYVLIYLGVGVVWGVTKWFFLLMKIRDKLVWFRNNYSISGPLSEQQAREFINYSDLRHYGGEIPPRVSDSKSRILAWMAFWPFSMPWTLINDPVKRVFNMLYMSIAGALQGMSNRMFKNLT